MAVGEHFAHDEPGPETVAGIYRALVQTLEHLCERALSRTAEWGVTGASVSYCLAGEMSGLAYASNLTATELEDLQSTLLDSPAQVALSTRGPVFISDLRSEPYDSWLGFSAEAQRMGVFSLYSVPLQIGVVVLGMLTVHGTASIIPGVSLTREIMKLADASCAALMAPAGGDPDLPDWGAALLSPGHALTHQAAGMITVQAQSTIRDALRLLHAAAFSEGSSVVALARKVVDRKITFQAPDDFSADEKET